jgi:AcrR family transcriptional regulator
MRFEINESLFVKDPRDSELGLRILNTGLAMIENMGLENFTFRKLAAEINSTEASIYRYFENKHKLLVFLSNWYWSWLGYRIMVTNQSYVSPIERLKNTLSFLASPVKRDDNFAYIDEEKLHKIIIAEGPKAYLIKDVDDENKEGYFLAYKKLCKSVSDQILAVNQDYKFAQSLASTIIETCHNQLFFSEHLPRLTDIADNNPEQLQLFINQFTFSTIKK